ncbi:hypothetical protein BGZ51_002864 [Haplosporangium sp. Z 767]|nr:hypothetical protein BGZ51_002864 [Haplosporangium sp. Z 767]
MGSPTTKSAEWLDWLIRTVAVNPSDCISTEFSREPMLLNLSLDSHAEFTSQGIQRQHGFNTGPGVRYYSQGTEEASRTKSPIQPSAAPSTRTKSSAHPNNNINSYTIPTRSWACESQESPLPEHSKEVPSPSPHSNQTTPNTHRAISRNREEADRKALAHSSSTSAPSDSTAASSTGRGSTASVGAGSTSALLYTTSQEFHQIWSQTTAFLYRTFSPTYRVGHLYLESWTNGTQKRGFERLQSSLARGDTFLLMRNTTTQLRDLWVSMAASQTRDDDAERHIKAIEDQRRQGHRHDQNQDSKSRNSNSDSSGSSDASENDQPRNQ